MAYYPSELQMLEPALMVDEQLEDDMAYMTLNPQLDSEINLYSRFAASQLNTSHNQCQSQLQNDFVGDDTFGNFIRRPSPIPMPMPGHGDDRHGMHESEFIDTPYQLKTLGTSLSTYSSNEPEYHHLQQLQNQHPPHSHQDHLQHQLHHSQHQLDHSESASAFRQLSLLHESASPSHDSSGPPNVTNKNSVIGLASADAAAPAGSYSARSPCNPTMGNLPGSGGPGQINHNHSQYSTNMNNINNGGSGGGNLCSTSNSAEELEVKQSDSSESQACYGTENVVSELRMEYVRWFYKTEADRKWSPFTGYDSMRIEARYRELVLREEEDRDEQQQGLSDQGQGYSTSSTCGPEGEHYGPYNVTLSEDNKDRFSGPTAAAQDGSSSGGSYREQFQNQLKLQHQIQSQSASTFYSNQSQGSQQQPPSVNLNTNVSANANTVEQSRTKRVYRSFTRKWKQWSDSGDKNQPGSQSQGSGGGGGQGQMGGPTSGTASPKHHNISSDGYGNSGSGTSNSNNSSSSAAGQGQNNQRNRIQGPPVPPPNNPDNIIIVRGGLYEVDLEHNISYATYWPDTCSICRGTWFYDGTWQPIDAAQADKLEIEHLEKFGGASLVHPYPVGPGMDASSLTLASSLPDSPTKRNKQVVHRISFSDFHVDWSSATEIHLYSKAVPHKLMRSVGQRFGFQTGGYRICRGFFKPCMLSDRPAEINHIVFVVHGIGQKMDTGRIVRNCAAFRDCITTLKKQFYPHSESSRQKAEFFPVEWRSAAKLDGDIVDAITPHKLLGLRQMLNATAMDIMYYTSPLYRTEIQNALRSELNRIYSNFVKRNPNFEERGGKVSVLAHSLGAVITYDIMTGYVSPLRSDCPELRSIVPNGVDTNEEINREGILVIDDVASDEMPQQPRMLFKLEHFFCLGSPLAVFLALRWKEPHNPDLRSYIFPPTLCKRIYNVFHPSDPVAYRLEPLLNKCYVRIAPLLIHSTGSSAPKVKYDEMEKELISRDFGGQQNQQQQQSKAAEDNTFNFANATHDNFGTSTSQSQQNYSQIHGSSNSAKSSSATSTPQKFISSFSLNSASAFQSQNQGCSLPTSTNLKSPPTPSKDSNWSWFNLMKYWKSPESCTDYQNSATAGAAFFGSPPGIGTMGGGMSNELGHHSAPDSMNFVNSSSPPESRPNTTAASQNQSHQSESQHQDEYSNCSYNNGSDDVNTNGASNAYAGGGTAVAPPVPNDLDYRMDFVLRESNLSSSYLAALTSHTSYWNTPDVAFFVLTHLYNGTLDRLEAQYDNH